MIIFEPRMFSVQAKGRGQRKLELRLFKLRAVPMVAEKTGKKAEEVMAMLAAASPPEPKESMSTAQRRKSSPQRRRPKESLPELPEVPLDLMDDLHKAFIRFASLGCGDKTQVGTNKFGCSRRETVLLANR